ncbi:hypothetical protein PS3A_15000 [Pseudomonas sp. 3A(2025)]
MPEHDAAVIRRPVLTGHQQIEGLWFPGERFSEEQCARLILEHWHTGASAWRFADGHLLQFRQPQSVYCEAQRGWPLIRQGRALCSAQLSAQERHNLPMADLWLVRGSQVSALQLRDATAIAPGDWLDVSAYRLLDTYDCRSILPEPVLEPLAVPSDVREILGDALPPVSPEQAEVLQALLARQRKGSGAPSAQTSSPAANDTWQKPDSTPTPGWVRVAIGLSALMLVAGLAGQASQPGASESSLVVVIFVAALLFTLLLLGVRTLLRRPASVRQVPTPTATQRAAAAAPALAPRATRAWHKPATWRRWLTRLTQHSRLSDLYGKRQAAYMRRMLEMFEDGDLHEALRHAIPLGSGQGSGEQSFGTPQRRDDLNVRHNTAPGRSMLFEEDMEAHLKQIYRQAFERLDREGRVDEAVFILAELLKVRQEALDYLEKHGRYQQAADLALGWDMPSSTIVRLLCLADDWQRALLVARRDDAFADAALMLREKWPDLANRLHLEWAQSFADKGMWLQAVDVIWRLPAERPRAVQWLLNAEAAGGKLGVYALVKRAILLPDTFADYGPWVEALRDDPQRWGERAAMAEALLQNKDQHEALAWLSGAMTHAILADQANGHGRLSNNDLQALVKMSQDTLLQADLPGMALLPVPRAGLEHVKAHHEWVAPQRGSRSILDAVALEGSRYLLALGEAGMVVIDATGKTLFHFPVPAQNIVMAHSRQVALVLARHDGVWRINKLDLVNRIATDLGVQVFNTFAKSFDGTAWTIGSGPQVRVVDVDRGFATLWHVGDLPGNVININDDAQNENWWVSGPRNSMQFWHYSLPSRRLVSREPMPARTHEDSDQLFSPSGQVTEYRVKHMDGEDAILVLEASNDCKGYRLPDCARSGADESDDPVILFPFEHWLVIGYITLDKHTRYHFIHRESDRLCAVIEWPVDDFYDMNVRCRGADWLLFDRQGRLSHVNTDEGTQRTISLN